MTMKSLSRGRVLMYRHKILERSHIKVSTRLSMGEDDDRQVVSAP